MTFWKLDDNKVIKNSLFIFLLYIIHKKYTIKA